MSDSNQESVGYKNPPRKSRFSAEHQPRRRRHPKFANETNNLALQLLEALSEPVSYSKNGKSVKAPVAAVLDKMLISGVMNGTVREKIQFKQMLIKSGILDVSDLKQKLEDEYAEKLKSDNESLKKLRLLYKVTKEFAETQRQELLYVSTALVGAISDCTCGTQHGFNEAAEFAKSVGDREEERSRYRAEIAPEQISSSGFPSGWTDDLSAGMIGND